MDVNHVLVDQVKLTAILWHTDTAIWVSKRDIDTNRV